MAETTGTRFSAEALQQFCMQALLAQQVSQRDAEITAWALVSANLEGIDTHGISRLGHYIKRIQAGLVNIDPQYQWTQQAPGTALLNADNSLGAPAALASVHKAVELAQTQGIAMVAARNLNHAAALSIYAEHAAAQGCICLMVCNTPAAMPPWGGKKAFLGTNPLAFSAPGPTDQSTPVVVDMATSLTARGNIILAAKRGESIPAEWATDSEGRPTTDPHAALNGGAVAPMGGAKGYALALMIEILSATLSGADFGPHVPFPYDNWDRPTNSGLWVMAIQTHSVVSAADYAQRLGALLDEIHAAPAAEGKTIHIPGEGRFQKRADRAAHGVPVDSATLKELQQIAEETGIVFPNSAE